jgi:hypothetical protein
MTFTYVLVDTKTSTTGALGGEGYMPGRHQTRLCPAIDAVATQWSAATLASIQIGQARLLCEERQQPA